MISRIAIPLAFLLAITTGSAHAEVTRQHQFDGPHIQTLTIDFNVGSLQLEASEDDTLHVEVRIRQSDRRRWFRRAPDLSSMDLNSRQHGDSLRLRFNEKGVNSDWIVRVPALSELAIDVGVGEIEITGIHAAMNIELGVGNIGINAFQDSVGVIDLSAGVGNTIIHGTGITLENRRALVSSETSALGNGTHTLRAETGVGTIELTLD